MAGTRIGGLRAAKTNKERYGETFFQRIGSIGGTKSNTGGFYANRELASIAGAKGGTVSRRRGIKNKVKEEKKAWLQRAKEQLIHLGKR